MTDYGEKAEKDLKRVFLNDWLDSMGLLDSLDEYECCCGLWFLLALQCNNPFWFPEHFVPCVFGLDSVTSVFLVGLCVGGRQVCVTC